MTLFDRLGAVLERLGGILVRLGASLARVGAILGRLGAILGRLGAILTRLGAILGRLGRILVIQKPSKIAPRGLPRSLQEASKMPSKTNSNIDFNLRPQNDHF